MQQALKSLVAVQWAISLCLPVLVQIGHAQQDGSPYRRRHGGRQLNAEIVGHGLLCGVYVGLQQLVLVVVVNAQMRLRNAMQSIMEQNASMAGLPGRAELDSAHRKIAELERLVRRIQRKADADDDAASPPPMRKAAAKPASSPKSAANKAVAKKAIAKKIAKPAAKKPARSVKTSAKPVAANRRKR